MLEANPEERDYNLEDALPSLEPAARAAAAAAVQSWLKSLPLARRPLVKVSEGRPPQYHIKGGVQAQTCLPCTQTIGLHARGTDAEGI